MGKYKTTKEWKNWFDKFESGFLIWEEYYKTITFHINSKTPRINAMIEFKRKYNNLNVKIVHLDYGFQYSFTDFVSLSIKKNFLISMSRIGNSFFLEHCLN